MASKMIEISKNEYKRLKQHEKVDRKLIKKLVFGIEDIKAGRIKKVL